MEGKWRMGGFSEKNRSKRDKFGKKIHFHLLQAQRKCLVSIRMEIVTYSVDSLTLNTRILFHRTWVVWSSANGRQAAGNVKGTFVSTERRYLLFRRFYSGEMQLDKNTRDIFMFPGFSYV